MPCSRYARATGAVPSGRSVCDRPPASSKVYISFWTMSVDSPTPRANSSVASNVGRLDAPVAGGLEDALGDGLDAPARGPVLGQHVGRAARRLDPLAHCASSARKGFDAFSRPRRGGAHVAGQDERVVGVALEQRGDRVQERLVVAVGAVGPPDRVLEQHVARGDDALVGERVGHVALGVAGRATTSISQARRARAARRPRRSRRRRSPRTARCPSIGTWPMMSAAARPRASGSRPARPSPSRAARRRRRGRRRVWVMQDRLDRGAELLDRLEQLLGLVARVDDERAAPSRPARST